MQKCSKVGQSYTEFKTEVTFIYIYICAQSYEIINTDFDDVTLDYYL